MTLSPLPDGASREELEVAPDHGLDRDHEEDGLAPTPAVAARVTLPANLSRMRTIPTLPFKRPGHWLRPQLMKQKQLCPPRPMFHVRIQTPFLQLW